MCRIVNVDYEINFPSKLSLVHSVFHLSILKKCIGDLTSIIHIEGLEVKENLSYEEVLVDILEHQVKRLRMKEVFSVRMLWINHHIEGVTWEAQDNMMSPYPHIFPPILSWGNEFLLGWSCFKSCVFYVFSWFPLICVFMKKLKFWKKIVVVIYFLQVLEHWVWVS